MADSNRGERSVDDELDDEFGDEGEDEAPRTRPSRSGGKSAVAESRSASRTKAKDPNRPGILGRLVHFVREVVAELQKVIWPTRKELLTYTTVVLFFVAVMMTIVALLDLGFAKTMFLVFGAKSGK